MAAISRIALLVVLTVLTLGAPRVQAQEPTPAVPDQAPPACIANLPPDVVATITPRRVVYLGTPSGAGARVTIEAYKSQDPEGQGLEYAFDVDGDGSFTPFSIITAGSESITMPGPFVAAIRARDLQGAIGVQQFNMEARRFSTGTFADSYGAPSAVAIVAGRPAVVVQGGPGFQFAINDQADGGGPWVTSSVLPIDWSIQGPMPDVSCPLAVWLGHPNLVCAYVAGDGARVLTHASNALPDGSGKWKTTKVMQVRGEPAQTLGAVNDGLFLAVFGDRALTLLRAGPHPQDAVMVSEEFELLWSTDVGDAPPASHSSVVPVGDPPMLPAIAYLDAAKGQLVVVVNQKADGHGNWDRVVVEPQQGDVGAPSLAMIGGRPAIAYRDGIKGYVKIAIAANPDGRGAWQVSVVDATTKPGGARVQSLAEIDGRAGVAYEHETRGLLFAYDPERPTADYWPAAVIDPRLLPFAGGGYHLNPSLALVAGRPAVIYNSAGGMQFAMAH